MGELTDVDSLMRCQTHETYVVVRDFLILSELLGVRFHGLTTIKSKVGKVSM